MRTFSILDLLIWTAIVAIVCGAIRGIGLPREIDVLEFGLFSLIGVPIVAFGVLLAMWSVLHTSETIGAFVLMNYVLALVLAIIVAALFGGPIEAVGYMFVMLATAITCVLFILDLYRHSGDRLVTSRRVSVAPRQNLPIR